MLSKQNVIYALLVLATASGFFGVGYALFHHSNTAAKSAATSAADSALRTAQLHQCIATNVTRSSDNWSHLSDFNFDTLQINDTKSSLQSNYAALEKIGLDRRVLNRALKQAEGQLVAQEADADSKTWMALTDCAAETSAGSGAVEVFSIAQTPPPWYVLGHTASQLQNAARPDPEGSVP